MPARRAQAARQAPCDRCRAGCTRPRPRCRGVLQARRALLPGAGGCPGALRIRLADARGSSPVHRQQGAQLLAGFARNPGSCRRALPTLGTREGCGLSRGAGTGWCAAATAARDVRTVPSTGRNRPVAARRQRLRSRAWGTPARRRLRRRCLRSRASQRAVDRHIPARWCAETLRRGTGADASAWSRPG
ncbi:hypothetical protein D9M72_538580 [compost metagenome]